MKAIRIASLLIIGAAIAVGTIPNAQATLVISTSTPFVFHDTNPSNLSASEIATDIGITTTQLGTLLFNTDNSSPGSLQSSYSSSSVNTYPVFLNYVSGTVAAADYLIVKDGNDGSYIFNLGSTGTDPLNWNGTEQIEITDLFGKGNGDLSHFEFYGGNASNASVPEPTTLISGALMFIPFSIALLRKAWNARQPKLARARLTNHRG